MANAAKDKPSFVCHARRHMSGAVYKTYDAMLAMALSGGRKSDVPLEFFGSIKPTLANYTNTSLTQLYEHIGALIRDGWLIPPPENVPQPRGGRGHLLAVRYLILEHSDFEANKVGPCPPYKYQQHDDKDAGIERGERLDKSEQPLDFMAETPKGRLELAFKRITGQLPGKDWKEIKANARKRGRK